MNQLQWIIDRVMSSNRKYIQRGDRKTRNRTCMLIVCLIKKSIQFCIDNLTSFLESDEDRVLELRKVLGCSRNVLGKCKEEIPKARGEIKSLMSELRRRAAQSINVIVPKLEGALSGDGEDEYESSSSEI